MQNQQQLELIRKQGNNPPLISESKSDSSRDEVADRGDCREIIKVKIIPANMLEKGKEILIKIIPFGPMLHRTGREDEGGDIHAL